MALENKLGITDSSELVRAEEGIRKQKAKDVLTNKIHDREVYMKGIDASYRYEGYAVYKTSEISDN